MSANADRMTAADAAWRRMDRPTNPMVITSLFTFGRALAFSDLEALIRERLLRIGRFRKRVVSPALGRPRFEPDPRFELAAHLRRTALPAPGGEAELMAAIEDLVAEPLDPDRPLWRVHAIEGAAGGTALLVRIHHSLGDGVALVAMLLGLTDEGRLMVPPEVGIRPPRPDGLVARARQRAAEANALRRMLMLPSDPPSPLRGPLGQRKRFARAPAIPLPAIRAAGAAAGATINDVVVAAIAGALRRHLAGRGFDGRSLRAMLPMYVRGRGGPADLGNRFGLVYLDLPLVAGGPADRLAEVHRRTRALKASPDATVALEVLGALGVAPRWIEDLGIALFTRKASVMITNVAGPPGRLHLADHEITDLGVWAPVSGALGLGVSAVSYAGAMRIGVEADAGLIPAPGELVDGIVHELAALGIVAPRAGDEARGGAASAPPPP